MKKTLNSTILVSSNAYSTETRSDLLAVQTELHQAGDFIVDLNLYKKEMGARIQGTFGTVSGDAEGKLTLEPREGQALQLDICGEFTLDDVDPGSYDASIEMEDVVIELGELKL